MSRNFIHNSNYYYFPVMDLMLPKRAQSGEVFSVVYMKWYLIDTDYLY